MLSVLKKMVFGTNALTHIGNVYKNSGARISINGRIGDMIEIGRGIK